MKIKYLKLKNWFLVSVMSLFGFSACNCHKQVAEPEKDGNDIERPRDWDNQVRPMYGGPVTDYRQDTLATPPKIKDQPDPREPQVTVYGVPTVNFAVKGRVVDSAGKPIKGVQVMLINSEIDPDNLPESPYWDEQLKRIADTTDAQGNFSVRTTDRRPWDQVRVMVTDIDGAKNGKFERQVVEVEFGDPEGGRDKWKLGERNAEVTVKMKRKK
jgi:putative lipoprotein (rSAM/lipoprotein system)